MDDKNYLIDLGVFTQLVFFIPEIEEKISSEARDLYIKLCKRRLKSFDYFYKTNINQYSLEGYNNYMKK